MECSTVAGAAAIRNKGGTELAAIALAWFTLDGFFLRLLKFIVKTRQRILKIYVHIYKYIYINLQNPLSCFYNIVSVLQIIMYMNISRYVVINIFVA